MRNMNAVSEERNEVFAVQVECYAGYRGEETPRRFVIGARRIEVLDVVDRWLAPDHRYFKLRGNDGGTYILREDVAGQRWELTLYDSRAEGAVGR